MTARKSFGGKPPLYWIALAAIMAGLTLVATIGGV